MSVATTHHSKDIWEGPYSFKPERFLEVLSIPFQFLLLCQC